MIARKPLVATDRAALMLQLVPYLIGKGEVSLAEAGDAEATRFFGLKRECGIHGLEG